MLNRYLFVVILTCLKFRQHIPLQNIRNNTANKDIICLLVKETDTKQMQLMLL